VKSKVQRKRGTVGLGLVLVLVLREFWCSDFQSERTLGQFGGFGFHTLPHGACLPPLLCPFVNLHQFENYLHNLEKKNAVTCGSSSIDIVEESSTSTLPLRNL